MDDSAKAAAPRAEKLNHRGFTRAAPFVAGIVKPPVMTYHLGGSAAVLDSCWGAYGTPPLGRRCLQLRLQLGYGLGGAGGARAEMGVVNRDCGGSR